MRSIGETTWVVTAGHIPSGYTQPPGRIPRSSEPRGRDGVLVLNTGDDVANVEVMLYFGAGDPSGPYRFGVSPSTMAHREFSQLVGAGAMATDTQFCAVLSSDNPVVVQHVQHRVRNDAAETISALAYPA